MEIITIIFVQVVVGVFRLLARAYRAKRIREVNSSLCNTCLHAHVASGFGRRKLTRCTYAWTSREMNFAISDCTMYRNRSSELVLCASPASRLANRSRWKPSHETNNPAGGEDNGYFR